MLEYNLTTLQANLEQKGYIVHFFDNKELAANYIDKYEIILIQEELGY